MREFERLCLKTKVDFDVALAKPLTADQLRKEHALLLGKNGALTRLVEALRHVPVSEKGAAGQRVNDLKKEIEAKFNAKGVVTQSSQESIL